MLARVTLSFESSYKMGLIPFDLHSEANCSFWYFVLVNLSIWPPSFCPGLSRFQESPRLWINWNIAHTRYLYVAHFTEGMWQWGKECFITKSNSKSLTHGIGEIPVLKSVLWPLFSSHFLRFPTFPLYSGSLSLSFSPAYHSSFNSS